MQTKGQLMKSLHTAFSFAPPSILSLTIYPIKQTRSFLITNNRNDLIIHTQITYTAVFRYATSPYKNTSFLFLTPFKAPSICSVFCCNGSGRILACSVQIWVHAMQRIHFSISVITAPSATEIAFVGQTVTHFPHFVQDGREIGATGIFISGLYGRFPGT